jgi:hypothetical protein
MLLLPLLLTRRPLLFLHRRPDRQKVPSFVNASRPSGNVFHSKQLSGWGMEAIYYTITKSHILICAYINETLSALWKKTSCERRHHRRCQIQSLNPQQISALIKASPMSMVGMATLAARRPGRLCCCFSWLAEE